MGDPNKSMEHFNKAIDYSKQIPDTDLTIKFTKNRVRLYLGKRNRELALADLESIKKGVFDSQDTASMIDWYCLKARAVDAKHEMADALKLADKAYQLNKLYKDPGMGAVINYTLGGMFFTSGEYEKARGYFQQAIEYYESKNELSLLLTLYTNMMAAWQGDNNYKKAMEYLNKKSDIQEQLGSEIGILATSESKARLMVDMGDFKSAKKQTELCLQLCREYGMDSTFSLYWMGIVHRGLDQYDQAAAYIKQAFAVALNMKNYGKTSFYAHALYQTYYWKDQYEEALIWYQSHIQFRDSIYSERQRKEIEVYTARFETIEKEKEFIRLEKEAEIDKLKRNRIFGILSSGIIIGVLVIILIVYRNKRRRQILISENALAESRRHEAELKQDLLQKEVDLKNQELASGMLQIARKNEFLIDLKENVDEKTKEDLGLKSIQRKIQDEINSEKDWDKFISSFRDVHPSYMKKLSEISSGLSKSETRLACLLKMNLSSKDIANMLNISSEGIKKARYRLRKKLGIEKDVDLYAFLVGLG